MTAEERTEQNRCRHWRGYFRKVVEQALTAGVESEEMAQVIREIQQERKSLER